MIILSYINDILNKTFWVSGMKTLRCNFNYFYRWKRITPHNFHKLSKNLQYAYVPNLMHLIYIHLIKKRSPLKKISICFESSVITYLCSLSYVRNTLNRTWHELILNIWIFCIWFSYWGSSPFLISFVILLLNKAKISFIKFYETNERRGNSENHIIEK